MKRRLLFATLLVGVLAGVLAIFSMSASAQLRTFLVKLPTGNIIRVTVDAPAGVPMDQVPGLPGTPIQELTAPGGGEEGGGPTGGGDGGGGDQGGDKGEKPPSSSGGGDQSSGGDKSNRPSSDGGSDQDRKRGDKKDPANADEPQSEAEEERAKEREKKAKERDRESTPLRNRDGSPTRNNPTFFDALPNPTPGTAVPNFVIRKFQVPIFLLPIYQAAGIQYGIRWEILAAINEIETDYGRNLNVSSAGALGWMQFMPATWRSYGVDANDDGKKDPYNPVDAIFAAARYLKAAGAEQDLRRAIFAYNHADWYVDSVMLRAKLIAGVPGDLVGSLTGLTQGRFPVAARARYANDVLERELKRRVKRGENAANVMEDADRREIDIFSDNGAPVVAANDGIIKKVGSDEKLGRYIVLQDVYGNRYTYSGLGSISQLYPVPKVDLDVEDSSAKAVSANADDDPKPTAPASAGRQVADTKANDSADDSTEVSRSRASVTYKPRLFAHPYRKNARQHGGVEQIFNRATSQQGYATYRGLFAHVYGLNAKNAVLRPLKVGSRVVAGTLLGRVGRPDNQKAAHLTFSIRPAGRGAPTIDPKPILDGWKLLESTAIYRANGKNALYSSSDAFSIGQILLLPKNLLQKRVLSDERVDVYPGGRADIRSGQIDRRVLATLEFLAESGLRPTVTSLRTGHSKFTSSGNVSHHWSGNAVDIAQINGVSILGHQDKGGVTEQAVKRLMLLQGTMRPDQIISLLDYGANTVSMGDHHDHIHVGFRPMFGENKKLGEQAMAVLRPGQWSDLIARLRELENPIVPTKPSKYALPADKKKTGRSSGAHAGE
jgi:hypothetical protein